VNENKIICFKSDTKDRKGLFKAASFAHPAKMHLSLQIYLIEHYTKPGDTILDPMAGSGTILMACALGRNVVCVELEDKFVEMQKANWQKIQALGPMMFCEMGEAVILQGDARNLDGLLADNILFSPPFSEQGAEQTAKYFPRKHRGTIQVKDYDKNNIQNLPYGKIPVVISSPPFQESKIRRKGQEKSRKDYKYGSKLKMQSEHPDNISRLAENNYGDADAILTSPPYEADNANLKGRSDKSAKSILSTTGMRAEKLNQENIGNLKSENYLEAMLQVYRQCHKVLKEKGLMILVVKNFIRDKKVIRLDLDTIKICEKAGFKLIERLKRKLTSQSFWRIIYHNKYPDVEKIEFEDVLVFERE